MQLELTDLEVDALIRLIENDKREVSSEEDAALNRVIAKLQTYGEDATP